MPALKAMDIVNLVWQKRKEKNTKETETSTLIGQKDQE